MSGIGKFSGSGAGLRLSLLVGALVTAIAVCALAVGSAGAAFTLKKCEGGAAHGEGSSLQNTAQDVWGSPGNKFDASAEGCAAGPNMPTVTYTKSSSLPALEAWGVGTGTFNSGDQYIATDEAPNGSKTTGQINEIFKASGESNVSVIPVIQAAIGVIVNPPENCTLPSTPQLANGPLEKAFRGEGASASAAFTWAELGASGTGCNTPVKRVVRADGSGTTYQFKHYLFEINSKATPCLKLTWNQLQEEVTRNTTWPESCEGHVLSPVVHSLHNGEEGTGSGGGDEVKTVNKTDGSIGYAALADVEGNKTAGTTFLAEIQNNGTEAAGATFAAAGAGAKESNCAFTSYGAFPTGKNNANWSKTYGSNPNISAAVENATAYPICTLTWDIALGSFSKTAITESQARTVADYLNYVVKAEGGQKDAQGTFYNALPKAVREQAEKNASGIGF